MKKEIIPTHDFYDKLERPIPFNLMELKEKSNYDFSTFHRHSYYEVFFFMKGGGNHTIDFNDFQVKSNSLHFVSPGQVHLLKRALNSNGYVLLFSREFYQLGFINNDFLYEIPFLNKNTTKPIIQIPEKRVTDYIQIFKKIQEENSSNNIDKEGVLRAYLNILMLQTKRLFCEQYNYQSIKLNNRSELVRKFKILVEKNFIKLHKPSEYADLLAVSAGHLNDSVHKTLGISASEFIYERIVLEAKRILLHSNETVQEIATILCFEDPSYFARFFKKHTTKSPKEFRETSRKIYK